MKPSIPIRSRWVGGPPIWTPAPDQPTAACARALMQSMMDSLHRGHHRVAARRYLMLCACRATVPEAARLACESTIARLPCRRACTNERCGTALGGADCEDA